MFISQVIDIVLTFNTIYFCDDEGLVRNRKKIAHNYIYGWFFFDVIWSIPLHSIAFMSGLNMTKNIIFVYIDIIMCAQVVRLLRQWN